MRTVCPVRSFGRFVSWMVLVSAYVRYSSLGVTSRERVWHLFLLYGLVGGVLLLGCYVDVVLVLC